MTTTKAIRIANDSPFCESRRSVKKLEDDLISDEAMHAPLHEIEKMMRSMRGKLPSVPTQARQQELTTAINYIANQNEAGRMSYADAINRNYPIGTGITEAAAKTIVGTRMKRAGSRFSQHGGQTVMTFAGKHAQPFGLRCSPSASTLHRALRHEYRQSVKEAA